MIDNLEISMVPALVLLPLLLRLAALHYLLGVTILTTLPALVLWYYYATHRRKRRTLFFLTLALYSLAYMYYLFITEILPQRTGFVTASLLQAEKQSEEADKESTPLHESVQSASSSTPTTTTSSSAAAESQTTTVTTKWSRCPVCKIMRPPRAGHCRTCGSCVQRLDHHCIWINSCVGQANHRSFLLTLCVFVLTSLYGISLVLCSLCPRQYHMTALFYCPGVYAQSSIKMHSTLLHLCLVQQHRHRWFALPVVVQVLNISFNVTEREAQLALRNKTGQSRLWGLVIDTESIHVASIRTGLSFSP
ncbi:hypothetical protein INR49_027872 [Caranx melampygus]|nr:hypothetical protein INR49_027872 [Caranx melampygus]